jgi:hypothetical protein
LLFLQLGDEDEDEEKPKPPEIVEVRVKPSVVKEVVKRRSNSPPRVTIVPLRAAHSLCSLVYDHDNQQEINSRKSSTSSEDSAKVQSPLRKTISVDDVSKAGEYRISSYFFCIFLSAYFDRSFS